eukprot:GHVL01024047.1.p2 GENE.GHVL01024047.1~~GHVL01024047.1.p2  ORF type:complete len:122 (+),score=7.76 GHVL01024047.1:357-722(+)
MQPHLVDSQRHVLLPVVWSHGHWSFLAGSSASVGWKIRPRPSQLDCCQDPELHGSLLWSHFLGTPHLVFECTPLCVQILVKALSVMPDKPARSFLWQGKTERTPALFLLWLWFISLMKGVI